MKKNKEAIKIETQFRQGDVFGEQLTFIPKIKKTKREKPIVAYGESTGHTHQFNDDRVIVLENNDFITDQMPMDDYYDLFVDTRKITDKEFVTLIHPEHADVFIPTGTIYGIKIQREYTPQEVRKVRD